MPEGNVEVRDLNLSENEPWLGYFYHHRRLISHSPYGIVIPDRVSDKMRETHEWIESRIGFYPLFLAVGDTKREVSLTGYTGHIDPALFSFKETPSNGVFIDHEVFLAFFVQGRYALQTLKGYKDPMEMFHRDWSKDEWLKQAKNPNGVVMLATPELDLRKADLITVPNGEGLHKISSLGFGNIQIVRT